MSILLSGEMEVDGNLKVTGTVESATIDSLKAVIANLQAQLAAMQADNKLETRVYEIEHYFNPFQSYNFIWSDIIGTEISYGKMNIISISTHDAISGGQFDFGDGRNSIIYHYFQYDNNMSLESPYSDIFVSNREHLSISFDNNNHDDAGNFTIKIAITAHFPN